MASTVSAIILLARLAIAVDTIRGLKQRITKIEEDGQMSGIEKLSQIRKIREEINKVSVEIDMVKNDIRLLNAYRVN